MDARASHNILFHACKFFDNCDSEFFMANADEKSLIDEFDDKIFIPNYDPELYDNVDMICYLNNTD